MSVRKDPETERLQAAHLALYEGIEDVRHRLRDLGELRVLWWSQDLRPDLRPEADPGEPERRMRAVQERLENAAAELTLSMRTLAAATEAWCGESRRAVEARFPAASEKEPVSEGSEGAGSEGPALNRLNRSASINPNLY